MTAYISGLISRTPPVQEKPALSSVMLERYLKFIDNLRDPSATLKSSASRCVFYLGLNDYNGLLVLDELRTLMGKNSHHITFNYKERFTKAYSLFLNIQGQLNPDRLLNPIMEHALLSLFYFNEPLADAFSIYIEQIITSRAENLALIKKGRVCSVISTLASNDARDAWATLNAKTMNLLPDYEALAALLSGFSKNLLEFVTPLNTQVHTEGFTLGLFDFTWDTARIAKGEKEAVFAELAKKEELPDLWLRAAQHQSAPYKDPFSSGFYPRMSPNLAQKASWENSIFADGWFQKATRLIEFKTESGRIHRASATIDLTPLGKLTSTQSKRVMNAVNAFESKMDGLQGVIDKQRTFSPGMWDMLLDMDCAKARQSLVDKEKAREKAFKTLDHSPFITTENMLHLLHVKRTIEYPAVKAKKPGLLKKAPATAPAVDLTIFFETVSNLKVAEARGAVAILPKLKANAADPTSDKVQVIAEILFNELRRLSPDDRTLLEDFLKLQVSYFSSPDNFIDSDDDDSDDDLSREEIASIELLQSIVRPLDFLPPDKQKLFPPIACNFIFTINQQIILALLE